MPRLQFASSLLIWLQRFIAVQIFVLGLFIFVSTSFPTHATVEEEATYTFYNSSYTSFALSLLPLNNPEFYMASISAKPIVDETVATEEASVSTQVTPAANYCLNIPIILYHHIQPYDEAIKKGQQNLTVDPNFFDQHISYLASSGYTFLTVDNLVSALQNKEQLPQKSIIVTIDDGYDDNYIYAYPILRKYNAIGNFMIPAGLMETPGYLTWGQIKDMLSTGQKMYNHTWSHAALGYITKEQIIDEVTKADKKLEEVTGIPQTILTYPYGSFNDLAIQTLREQGFTAALTTIHGRWQCDNSLMTLYRDHVGNAPLSSYGL